MRSRRRSTSRREGRRATAEERQSARRERARRHLERMRQRGGVVAMNEPRVRQRRRRRLATLAFALALGVGTALTASTPARDASLREIGVLGHQRLSAPEVARATGLAPGQALAEIEPERVAGRLAAHPWVRDARAVALPGGDVVVAVAEREPVAVVAWGAGAERRHWLVDRQGTPFAPAGDAAPGLPRFEAPAPLAADVPEPRLAAGLALPELLPSALRERAVEWRAPPPGSRAGWILAATDAPALTVVLGDDRGHGELPRRLARLALLLESGRAAVAHAREIDLRFANQAVLRDPRADTAEPSSGSG